MKWINAKRDFRQFRFPANPVELVKLVSRMDQLRKNPPTLRNIFVYIPSNDFRYI